MYPAQLGSLKPFSERVMKWAYLKIPNLGLPEASAQWEALKIFVEVKLIQGWQRKEMVLSYSPFSDL